MTIPVMFRLALWCCLTALPCQAVEQDALLRGLVKKGVLSEAEASEIQAEPANGGSFLQPGDTAVKAMRLYGDARLRYEYRADSRNDGDHRERQRYRYRLRIGAEYRFTDNFSSGFRLATGTERRSASADFGMGELNYRANDQVHVDLVYLNWEQVLGVDWLAVSAGRIVQPHNLNCYTWTGDLTADGGAAKLGTWRVADGITLGSTHGAYIWTDKVENPFDADGGEDVFLFINQADLTWHLGGGWAFRFSPAWVNSIGDRSHDSGNITWQSDLNGLDVLVLDFSLHTPFFGNSAKGRLYGEYGVNFSDQRRARELQMNKHGGDNQFFNIGYEIRTGKGKGAWCVDAGYAYFEALSWSAHLVNATFNAGMLNAHGPTVKVAYGVTDNITASVLWHQAWALDGDLTGPASDCYGGGQDGVNLVQVDLNWRF